MESKRGRNRAGRGGSASEARRLWAAGALLAVVLGTLLLAAVLEADPRGGAPIPTAAPTETPLPAEILVEPEPRPAPPAAPENLDARARRDAERLSTHAGQWTLQLMMACDEAALRRSLERSALDEGLFLIEAPDQGRGCFRVVWGNYPSRDAAAAATDVPAGLLAPGESPWPRPARQVLEP